MVDLNDPVWKTLSSAGNDADKWLQALIGGKGSTRENIEIVAEDLSHQLIWYSATAYALPHLAAFCPTLSKEDKVFLIAQMGAAIAAEASCPLAPNTQAYLEFQEGLEGLRKETKPLITDPDVHDLLEADAELGSMFALGPWLSWGIEAMPMAFGLFPVPPGKKGTLLVYVGGWRKKFLLRNNPSAWNPLKLRFGTNSLWTMRQYG